MLKTILLTGMALGCIGPARAGSFVFHTIDVPDTAFVRGINSSNVVVGGFLRQTAEYPENGFVWMNGVTTVVTVPGQTSHSSFALVGIDRQGVAAGVFGDPSTGVRNSFLYDVGSARVSPITAPAGYYLSATAMSGGGIVVGLAYPLSPGQQSIFTKPPGKSATLLGPAFAQQDRGDVPVSVASTGEIVGYSFEGSSDTEGFRYLDGSFSLLAAPADATGGLNPSFVNNRGVIAGTYQAGAKGADGTSSHGFVQRGSQLHTVDFPKPAGAKYVDTSVAGLTRTGDILGSYDVTDAHDSTTTHGFNRHDGVWGSFDVPGATSTFVATINEQGSVAGTYSDARGVSHAFVGICSADQAPCTQ